MSYYSMLGSPLDIFPQSYIVACGETQQFQRLGMHNGSFKDFFLERASRDDIWFWNSLAEPVDGKERVQQHCAVSNPQRLAPLERLPNELLELVLDALQVNQLAILSLGLASPVLYSQILSRIHRDYMHNRTASWAGKEIGFYGSMAPVPPAPILKFRRDWLTHDTANTDAWYTGWNSISMQPEHAWRKSLLDARSRWKKMDDITWDNVDQDLSQDYMYPQDRVWVLRNLNKRQFVRSDGLIPSTAILEHPLLPPDFRRKSLLTSSLKIPLGDRILEPLTLPQVLLVLTAYSAHPDWRDEDLGFRCGPWVSHFFEVVTLDAHVECAGSEWEDVSAEVAGDVGHFRWCAMQHAALSQPLIDGLWEKLKKFRTLVPKARKRWTRWAQDG